MTSTHLVPVTAAYARVQVSANLGTPATGTLQTLFRTGTTAPITSLGSGLTSSSDALTGRSVITSSLPSGTFGNITSSVPLPNLQGLHMSVLDPITAFGEVRTAQSTPIIQATTMYDLINPQVFTIETTGTGSVTSAAMRYSVTNSTVGVTSLVTVAGCHYQPGQSMLIRLTGVFPNGEVANSRQLLGFGNAGNGLYFGYVGTGAGFGILFRRDGLSPV